MPPKLHHHFHARMTELFNTLKSAASVREKAKLDAMRIKAEQFRLAQDSGCDQCAHSEPCGQTCSGQQQQDFHKYSPSPSVFAYAKAQQCKAAKLPNSQVLIAKAVNKQVPIPPEEKPKKYVYKPDADFIYVPPKQQIHYVSKGKAQLGQTTLVANVDQGAETLYRDHFLETQMQNDFCTKANRDQNKATDGLQPLQAVYIVDDGERYFAKSQTNKLINADLAAGLLKKDINREERPVDPKDKYIETFKRTNLERSDAFRPYAGGTCLVRKIKEEDWTEIPQGVKQLKLDMRTTYRTEFPILGAHAYDISARDRATCHEAFIKEHTKENPVGGGVHHPPITTNQFFQSVLIQHDQEQRAAAEERLKNGATQAAEDLYGINKEDAKKFVSSIHEGDRQALLFLSEQAKRNQQEWQ